LVFWFFCLFRFDHLALLLSDFVRVVKAENLPHLGKFRKILCNWTAHAHYDLDAYPPFLPPSPSPKVPLINIPSFFLPSLLPPYPTVCSLVIGCSTNPLTCTTKSNSQCRNCTSGFFLDGITCKSMFMGFGRKEGRMLGLRRAEGKPGGSRQKGRERRR
jgi:hypothetical protein